MLLGVLVSALFLVGCSVVGKVADKAAENERITEAVIKNRTLSFLDGDPDKAEILETGARRVLSVLEADPEAKLSKLGEVAEATIPWGDLSAGEERVVRGVMELIGETLDDPGGHEALTDRQRVRLRAVLGWVVESAEIIR